MLRVTELLKLIPQWTFNQVDNAYKDTNLKIRNALKDANLRLSMQWENNDFSFNCRCPVNINKIGYPEEFKSITIADEYKLAALLSIYFPSISALNTSSASINHALSHEPMASLVTQLLIASKFDPTDIREQGHILKYYQDALSNSNKLASLFEDTVKKHENQFDLVRHILAVNKDILGDFSYRPTQDQYDKYGNFITYAENYNATINLYWGIIGLVAHALNVSVAGLTIVVLTHELAHAYTHLGFDRDGTRWHGRGFENSDHPLKEGLAQYYTAIVVERFPEAKQAYKELLPKQPPAYQAHAKWLEKATPEAIGSALAVMRRKGVVSYNEFDQEVQQSAQRLKR